MKEMERKDGEYYYIWDRGKYPIYQHHDNAPDKWIDTCYKKIHGDLMYDFKRLDTVDVDGEDYVKLSDVENMIENNV